MKSKVIGAPLRMDDLKRLPESQQWPNTSKGHKQVLESTSCFLKRYAFETKDKLEGAGPLHFHHPGTEDWERGGDVILRPVPGPLGLYSVGIGFHADRLIYAGAGIRSYRQGH